MDAKHFDTLTRTLIAASSRRRALRLLSGLGLVGLLGPAETAAKRKHKHKHRKKHKPQPAPPSPPSSPPCVPEDPAITCAAGCGSRTNNCAGVVYCQCPTSQSCLGNGDCAGTCNPGGTDCPADCLCPGNPSVEGPFRCVPISTSCDQALQACEHTAECPRGQHCQVTQCSPSGEDVTRCLPLCP
jgi:hypothetical protein